MPKEITILKYSFNPFGGLEKQALLISNAFLEKGYKVSILTTSKEKIPSINSFIIKKGPPFALLRLFYWQILSSRYVEKNKPSIVLALDRTTNQTHLRAGNGVHRAYLNNRKKFNNFFKNLSIFLNPLHRAILYLEKKAFRNSSLKKIIVNSQMVKDEITKYYKVPGEKITVIHNGVEWRKNQIDFEKWQEKKIQFLKNFGLKEKHVFLFCGNGYERKGLKLLLQALSSLQEDFYLLVVGKDKKLKKYQTLAQDLNIEKKVIFFGFQNELKPFYQVSDTFVLPSLYDPFANTTIEALSFGLFNITSRENGASEILNKENGIILESLDVINLALALKKAILLPKTSDRALKIRNSIKHLEAKKQLNELIETIYE